MSRPKLYIDFSAFKDICYFPEEFPHWHKILYNYVDVHINPIGNEPEDHELLVAFENATPSTLLDIEQELFENFENEDLSDYPRDIFILNISDVKAEELTAKYGVLVLSDRSFSNFNIKGRGFQKKLNKETDIDKTDRVAWDQVLSDYKPSFPSNAFIINDNYAIDNNLDTSILNLKTLLSPLLPVKLNVPVHILINLFNSGQLTKGILDKAILYLEQELSKPDRTVKVTIQTHPRKDEYHPRYILSNYLIVESEHGFNAYDSKNQTIKWSHNDFKLRPNFFSVDADGDIDLKWSLEYLKQLKNDWNEFPQNARIRKNEYIRSGNDSNRLIDSFKIDS